MAIVFTRYEDSVNNNIVFDSSRFDFSFDSDTFPTDAASDFENIILENGDVFQVIKQDSIKDGMGTVSAISNSSFRIYAWITDISKKDRIVHDMGLAVPGNRIIYVMPAYTLISGGVSTSYIIKEGDIFIGRDSSKWRIIKIIHEPHINNTEIYKKAVVQSISLRGSR